jgi:hypothetical protein
MLNQKCSGAQLPADLSPCPGCMDAAWMITVWVRCQHSLPLLHSPSLPGVLGCLPIQVCWQSGRQVLLTDVALDGSNHAGRGNSPKA